MLLIVFSAIVAGGVICSSKKFEHILKGKDEGEEAEETQEDNKILYSVLWV